MWRKHAPMPNFVVFVKNPRIMRGFVIFPGTATSLPRLLLLRNVTIRARIHIRIQAVAPSDRQPPLPARTPRTFLTPKVFSFSVICLVMMMTSPVFFQIVKSTLLMIARIIMLRITMMRMMMLMVMIITTMKIMMMITMVMIWSLPKPVYRSLPLPTLFLPPPPPAIVSLLQLNLLMTVLLISLQWNLSLFFPPLSQSHWPSQFSRIWSDKL